MNWGKQGAFLMLAVVVCWAAMPAFACLPAARSTGQPDCCRGMALECSSPDTGANGSCCPTHPQNIAAGPVLPYSPEHGQTLAVAAHEPLLPALVPLGARYGHALESPPLISPPGGSSILRI
jgi:hypothetical protein